MKDLGLMCFILLDVLSNFEVFTTTVTIHSVGSLRDTGSVQCGSKVTFICSIPKYIYNMVWFIDSDKVAECTTTNCVQYPPYKVDNIEFSPDTNNGEFNMTINQVSLKADGRTIKCRYGSEDVQLKMAVKVFPTKKTTNFVESKDDKCNMIKITATTGCVFPRSAISMQWYYYEEGHKPKLYKMSSPIDVSNVSVCSSGTCGGNGVVKISSTLSIPDEQNGIGYFFQIAIRNEDAGEIILNSTRSYKINELLTGSNQKSALQELRIHLCTSVFLGCLALVFINIMVIVVTIRWMTAKRGKNRLIRECDKIYKGKEVETNLDYEPLNQDEPAYEDIDLGSIYSYQTLDAVNNGNQDLETQETGTNNETITERNTKIYLNSWT